MRRREPHPMLPALLVTALLTACASAPVPSPTPAPVVDVPAISRPEGETAAWWFRDGAAQAASRGAMDGRARNVILFVGDGMSLPTVAAARILAGQQAGAPGEAHRLSWEHFPATALSRTYNTDAQTPDSAGTMTAMSTGVKTRAGHIAVGPSAPSGDCAAGRDAMLLTLWELAETQGLSTGVVSTTRVTHATPAATFTHGADRGWEGDTDLSGDARRAGCIDYARQWVESTLAPDVLLGGGRAFFMPGTQADPEYPDQAGGRGDGRDLVAAWQRRHPGGTYAWNAAQLAAAPLDGPLLGLFERWDMHYEHDRPGDAAGEPSLADMTQAAIARLERDQDGYLLLVEGGRIDHAGHDGNAYRALTETIAMADAVQVAVDMTSADDTLVIVTADHSHTLGFVGYPVRGNPILGLVRGDDGELSTDTNGLPYTTLAYANGPGYTGPGRPDLSAVDTTDPDYRQEAMVPLGAETHGGDDVGVWARGPGSAAVRGSIEQNALFHLMLQATPRLRDGLCDAGLCNADGVPVELPRREDFVPAPVVPTAG
ncbi:MAG TPA: alkaline phosphatase [Xanthomonadaceae bacterium]|nr:alkaline phosphatase [Xanthomonadaceae bacterium]